MLADICASLSLYASLSLGVCVCVCVRAAIVDELAAAERVGVRDLNVHRTVK